jgi:hypothetical protein
LSQVGSLIHAVLSGKYFFKKSAPTLSAPEPPSVWIVTARPLVTASCSAPKSRCWICWRVLAAPTIGR